MTKVIDFTPHGKRQEISALGENDWAHVHVTDRTLTFDARTYNLNSELSIEVRVPKLFFGEEKRIGGLDGGSLNLW